MIVPDARDLERLDQALDHTLDQYRGEDHGRGPGRGLGRGPGRRPGRRPGRIGATNAADRGQPANPALGSRRARTRRSGRPSATARFLRASRGEVPVVIGTRAAAFAPVPDLGLVAIWDDGDDLHAEPRAPYPHALQVLLIRAQLAERRGAGRGHRAQRRGAAAGGDRAGPRRSSRPRDVVRRRAPAVAPTGDDFDRARDPAAATARLPSLAWRAARDALAAGAPVLVQVPRRGYLPSVSCVECHTPARCARCAGPLELRSSHAVAACRWCGRPAADFACHRCGGRRLRAAVVGAGRTAEELGRAFPGVPVRTSGRDGCWPRWRRSRRWWWPRRAPSRWPRAATAPCCCWTRGRC